VHRVSDASITFIVLAVVVVLFVWNVVPVELVAVGAALTLYATGVLTLNQSLAGFGDPTVLFIAALFVVSEGLDAGGVTAWLGRELVARAGENRTRLLVFTLLLAALLTAFITPNASVTALMPVVVVMAAQVGWPPSLVLMPLAFAAHAGSMLALTGTPLNVITSDAAAEAHVGRFGFFDFTLVGVPLVAGMIAITLLLGKRLLPERRPRVLPPDFSQHARALVEQYFNGTSERSGADLLSSALVPDGSTPLFSGERGIAEVVIPPRSGLIGETVFPGMVTESGDLVVVAVQRHGKHLDGADMVLAPGDVLLLRGRWEAFERHLVDPDVLVVDVPELVRRQVVPMGVRGKLAVLILAGMIVLLASGAVPPAVAGLLGAGAMTLLRVVTMEQAYRAMSWTTIVLVGAMLPMSTAMQQTGAAKKVGDAIVNAVGHASSYLLVLGLVLVTVTLGQLISNTATALILIPIAVSAAADAGVSARPLLMAVNVAAAASFFTPVATPANMIVQEPAGYRFGDYWKFGLPMMLLFITVATFLVPVFWPF
jgi:di/tricarboxylate transporter